MLESEGGDYILHTDHAEAMAGKDARIKALEDSLRELCSDYESTLRYTRASVKRDHCWEGFADGVKPKIDAARALLQGEGPNAHA
jgi:hypothetical protein